MNSFFKTLFELFLHLHTYKYYSMHFNTTKKKSLISHVTLSLYIEQLSYTKTLLQAGRVKKR